MVTPIYLGLRQLGLGEGPYTVDEVARRIAFFQWQEFGDGNLFNDAAAWGEFEHDCLMMHHLYSSADEIIASTNATVFNIGSMTFVFDCPQVRMSRSRLSRALRYMKTMEDLMIPEFKVSRVRYCDLAYAKASRRQKVNRQRELDAMSRNQLEELAFRDGPDIENMDVPF